MTREIRRLSYREVQRLNDAALERRILSIAALRENRIDEIRETERRYIRRFLEEGPRPDEIASEIDRDQSLAKPDRDLLVSELFALDIRRKRRTRREKEPAPEKVVPRLTAEFVEALSDAGLRELGKDLLEIKSDLVSARRRTFDPETKKDTWLTVLDDDRDPIEYYVGMSPNSDIEALSIDSFSDPENSYVANRILWLREDRRRRNN